LDVRACKTEKRGCEDSRKGEDADAFHCRLHTGLKRPVNKSSHFYHNCSAVVALQL
jgi:hypothetical protein